MIAATIVTEDAEKLVREGGLVNRAGGENEPALSTIITPFAAEVAGSLDAWKERIENGVSGMVTVVDVHHADDCENRWWHPHHDEWTTDHCRPGAEPDAWHWTVEPRMETR